MIIPYPSHLNPGEASLIRVNMEKPSLTYLKELSNGNSTFEMKIFKILIEELPEEYNAYQNAIRTKNFYWAADIVHKIKQKVAFFQMHASVSISEEHESSLRSGKLKYQSDFQEIVTKILKFLPEHYD